MILISMIDRNKDTLTLGGVSRYHLFKLWQGASICRFIVCLSVPKKISGRLKPPFQSYVSDFLYALLVDVPVDKYDWKKLNKH